MNARAGRTHNTAGAKNLTNQNQRIVSATMQKLSLA
jgi:hypothetical protein